MKPILTMDFETDPFEHGNNVEPFCVGLYDGRGNFYQCWSKDCVTKIVAYLDTLPSSIIYMHNGGRFDFFFLLEHLAPRMVIINGRIVQAYLGKHELRDSYAALPIPLSGYKKDEIDINKLHRDVRNQNRGEILSYLQGDCVYLHELISGFIAEFGDYLTIGAAAMNQLQRFHKFNRGESAFDNTFRSQFFYGGRVQCFQSGIMNQSHKIYDVNSMYPAVMKNFRHPNACSYSLDRRITNNTAFIVAEGSQSPKLGAFPVRTKTGIDFTSGAGTFYFSKHEWEAAEETGLFRTRRILNTYNFDQWISFDEFVEHFFNARRRAKKDNDKLHDIFYKLILNSAYGKFAQNPDNFRDYAVTRIGHVMDRSNGWSEHTIHADGKWTVWERPVSRHSYYNVSIGASITGAARSVLMRAIAKADTPIYCDTDSIICESLSGVPFSETELGSWKLEGVGDRLAIAGKKLYACYDSSIAGPVEAQERMGFGKHQCLKHATKGARISPSEIERVARGETVTFRKDAPTFKLDGRTEFIKRDIRRTV